MLVLLLTALRFTPQHRYIHRVGRTGRFGTLGVAVNLVAPQRKEETKQLEVICDFAKISVQVSEGSFVCSLQWFCSLLFVFCFFNV